MTKKRIFTILFYMYIVFLIFVIVLKFDGSFEKIISLHHSITENAVSYTHLTLPTNSLV